MAGKGQRFAEAGYKQSKPLIPVSGKPMILQAVASMPPAEKWVFVIRQEHLKEKRLIKVLQSVGKKVEILVDKNPTGQLNSCLAAKKFFQNEKDIFIGACDFGMVYDQKKYLSLLEDKKPDIVSWSFTQQPNLVHNPQAWGWLKFDANNDNDNDHKRILGVSVKVPISDDPFNDHAITGSFSFKDGKTFLRIVDELIRRDIKVKGEYYIDSMIGVGIDLGLSAYSFPVNKYIGWGTPNDLKVYQYWESYFKLKG